MKLSNLLNWSYTKGSAARWIAILTVIGTILFGLPGLLGSIPNANPVELTCEIPTTSPWGKRPALVRAVCTGTVGATGSDAHWPWKITIPIALGAVALLCTIPLERIDRDEKAALDREKADLANEERNKAIAREELASRERDLAAERAAIQSDILLAICKNLRDGSTEPLNQAIALLEQNETED